MRYTPSQNVPEATNEAVSRALDMFMHAGCSIHAPDATVLAPMLNALEASNMPYTLSFRPRVGYYVERGARFPAPSPTLGQRIAASADLDRDPRPDEDSTPSGHYETPLMQVAAHRFERIMDTLQ